VNKIKVMVIDDHPMVREGIAAYVALQPDMELVAETGDGTKGIELFNQYMPDITLVDLRLPNMDGIEIIRQIRRDFPEAKFIVVTSYDFDEQIYAAFRAGARAYVLKDVLANQLIDIIRRVHKGQRYLSTDIEMRLAERLPRSDLTARELEILNLFASGMSNKEIATTLTITENTVRFHSRNLFQKLEVNDRAHAVSIALRRGLIPIN
jgi:two-component system, NarL family, response regulator